MRRLWPLVFASICGVGCVDSFLGPPPANDHVALFDDVWTEFDLHYSFFAYKGVDWDSLRTVYQPIAIAAPSDSQFADVLGRMLGELRDVHVSITPGTSSSTIAYLSKWDTVPTNFDPAVVFSRYVRGSRFTSGRHMRYGLVAPTTAYIRIPDFSGSGWASEMDEVIDSLPSARSFIIDIRDNPGGNVTSAVDIAARFADRERTYGYVRIRNGPAHTDFSSDVVETVAPGGRHFSGPVYVLSNRRDFSAAEDFVLAMRALPGVVVVGDTTAGASGGPIVRELPNGWTYQLSEWLEYTSAHRLFEGIGLPPDVCARPTPMDARDSIDVALERARVMADGGQ